MLASFHAANLGIVGRRPVSAVDIDGLSKVAADALKNHHQPRSHKHGIGAVVAGGSVSCGVVVYCLPNRHGKSRLGLTVSTKVGKAVVRNRVRRRLREMYRLHLPEMKKGYDVILVGRVKAVYTPYDAMDRQYVQALQALGLWEDRT